MTASLVSFAVFLAGCSGTSVSNTANTPNTNQALKVSNNASTVNNSTNAVVAPNSSTTNINSNSTSNINRNTAAVKEPTPQIGSGGNDLMLFSQVRSTLSADKELADAVIIEVKEGNVTLSGKVSSAAQKAKAEELIKPVNGVKSIKNNIAVSK